MLIYVCRVSSATDEKLARLGDSSYDNAYCPLNALTEHPGQTDTIYALCGHALVQHRLGKDRIVVKAGSITQTGL